MELQEKSGICFVTLTSQTNQSVVKKLVITK